MGASPPSRRHLMLAALAALLPVVLIALAGCGSSGGTTESTASKGSESGATESTSNAPLGASVKSCPNNVVSNEPIRVAGVSCAEGQATVQAWSRSHACLNPSMTSRSSCAAGRYRCLSVRTESAIAVNCSRKGRSVSFRVDLGEPSPAGQ